MQPSPVAPILAPALFEVRASVLVASLWGERPTLADVPTAYFADLAGAGFEILYLLGVWQTGEAGLQHSVAKITAWLEQRAAAKAAATAGGKEGGDAAGTATTHEQFEADAKALAVSSPFAITDYVVHADLGGDEALRVFKVCTTVLLTTACCGRGGARGRVCDCLSPSLALRHGDRIEGLISLLR